MLNSSMATRLRNREKFCGAWAQLGSNISAEILAEAGFDVIVPDMEHAPYSLPTLVSVLQAIKASNCFSMVRTPWNDAVLIKQILDCGAQGIHVPYICNREQAEYAVQCCKYPPDGIRGMASSQRAVCYGMHKMEYFHHANDDIIVMVAIETPEGVERIEEIASVDGVDGIFIGPTDLSTSMGYLADPSNPEVQKAIRYIEKVTLQAGKFLGTISSGGKDMEEKYSRGYSLLYLFSDASSLCSAAVRAVNEFKALYRA